MEPVKEMELKGTAKSPRPLETAPTVHMFNTRPSRPLGPGTEYVTGAPRRKVHLAGLGERSRVRHSVLRWSQGESIPTRSFLLGQQHQHCATEHIHTRRPRMKRRGSTSALGKASLAQHRMALLLFRQPLSHWA